MTSPSPSHDPQSGFIDTIVSLQHMGEGAATNVGAIVDVLDERAFGLLILLFAIPCLVPGLPGAQLIAIPIFLLGAQLAAGRTEIWLPKRALEAPIKRDWLVAMAGFADKRLRWTQRLSRPRWRGLASGLAEQVIGLIIALAAITIMLPITNTIPSLAITLVAVGLLQRDGLFTLAGVSLASAWIIFLAVMIWGLLFGAEFAVGLVSEHLPWLAQWIGQ